MEKIVKKDAVYSELELKMLENAKNYVEVLKKTKQQPKEVKEILQNKLGSLLRIQETHKNESQRMVKPNMSEMDKRALEFKYSVYNSEIDILESLLKKV